MSNMSDPKIEVPTYEEILTTYRLDLLIHDRATGAADLSLTDTGSISTTKDGDFTFGDTAHNALFRFVIGWQYRSPYMRDLFAMIAKMKAFEAALTEKRDKAAAVMSASFEQDAIANFHSANAEVASAGYGTLTYAGSLILAMSGMLLRFRDDAKASADEWDKAAPLFNGCSFGKVVVAAANGVRHDDEWAKTRLPDAKQKKSQDVLNQAMAGSAVKPRTTPGLTVEIADLLSSGGNFERLVENMFKFVHNVAVLRRKRE